MVCAKPSDSRGSCRFPMCTSRASLSQACRIPANETGMYMYLMLEERMTEHNEFIVQARPWPSDIIEASFGDPLLPGPHLQFDPFNWRAPFS